MNGKTKCKQTNGLLSDITYFLKNVFLLPYMWITKASVVGKQGYWIVMHVLNWITQSLPPLTLLAALGLI